MKNKRAELEKEYRKSIYVVFADEIEIIFRIGENSHAVNRLLNEHNARNFAFITAENPRSEILTDAENKARQAELRKTLCAEKLEFLEGYGADEKGNWKREKSFFIFDVSPIKAAEIGKKFEQNAIVCGAKDEKTELVWCAENQF